MKGSQRVIDGLNDGLTNELTAINQYFIQAKMCQHWGLHKLGKKHYDESIDEMKHAETLIDHILFLEGVPEIARYDVIKAGTDPRDQLEKDLESEKKAVELYNNLITVCNDENDSGSRDLAERLLKDEEEHVDWLETQLELIDRIGLENYLLSQVGEEEA